MSITLYFIIFAALSCTNALKQYKFVAEVGPVNIYYGTASNFFIPNKQCNGEITPFEMCRGEEPVGVQVTVKDNTKYPMVHIANSLEKVLVVRTPNEAGECTAPADVEVRVACPTRANSYKNL